MKEGHSVKYRVLKMDNKPECGQEVYCTRIRV
jgi:hypothetical protein